MANMIGLKVLTRAGIGKLLHPVKAGNPGGYWMVILEPWHRIAYPFYWFIAVDSYM